MPNIRLTNPGSDPTIDIIDDLKMENIPCIGDTIRVEHDREHVEFYKVQNRIFCPTESDTLRKLSGDRVVLEVVRIN